MDQGEVDRALSGERPALRSASLAAYFSLTFVAAWGLWIAAASLTPTSLSPATRGLFFMPGTFAPGFVALWMTVRAEGAAGVRALLDRLFRWRVGPQWYVFAVVSVAAAKLASAIAHRAVEGSWPAFEPLPWYVLLVATAFSTPSQAGEEIGWRGYALPRLASRMGLGPASIVLGVIWAAWHLPFFYMPGTGMTGQPFLPYLLAVTAISVAMAGLYWRTGGSLLLVMIMHAAVNNLASIVPSDELDATDPLAVQLSPLAWITTAALWAIAACFLVWMRRSGAVLTAAPTGPSS